MEMGTDRLPLWSRSGTLQPVWKRELFLVWDDSRLPNADLKPFPIDRPVFYLDSASRHPATLHPVLSRKLQIWVGMPIRARLCVE